MRNTIDGPRLSGYKAFTEYIGNLSKDTQLTYDLAQFERELKNEAFRENDANAIMYFLGRMNGLFDMKEFTIRSPQKREEAFDPQKTPFIEFSGKKYPHVQALYRLDFLKMSYPIISTNALTISSNNIYESFEKFSGTPVYDAWQLTLQNLQNEVKGEVLENKIFFRAFVVDEHHHSAGNYFQAEVNVDTDGGYASLEETVGCVESVCDAVEKSYNATMNVPKEHRRMLTEISMRLLQTSP